MTAKVDRILIADDEPLYLRTTGDLLRKAGFECVCVADAKSAMDRLHAEPFDLVLTDLNMPGNFKLELLQDQSVYRPHVPMVVVTGAPSLPTAIESLRMGICDYLLKPVKFEDLLACVRRVIAGQRSDDSRPPIGKHEAGKSFPQIIGESQPMLELFEIIDRVANSDVNVLITGESGTGKELIANAIHARSGRNQGNFQIIDCTAVPEALFESMLFGHKKGSFTGAVGDAEGLLKQCHRGTAFFDELGELPASLQSKLLRAVQEQTFTPVGSHLPVSVDTRFVSATNRDLEAEVRAGRFRQDLYYRLCVIQIELPPLRDRGDDILLLADRFLTSLRRTGSPIRGFDDEAIRRLRNYSWPGNIRELRNIVERALTLARGDLVTVADLPVKLRQPLPAPAAPVNAAATVPAAVGGAPGPSREQAMDAAECQYLLQLMRSSWGNVSEASRLAGLSRQGMHKLLKKHDINAADFRDNH